MKSLCFWSILEHWAVAPVVGNGTSEESGQPTMTTSSRARTWSVDLSFMVVSVDDQYTHIIWIYIYNVYMITYIYIYIYNVYINVWIDLIWCDWIRSIIHSMNLWICISLSSSISIYNQYHISISIQCGKRATGSHLLKVLVADECCRSDLHGGLQLQQCQVTLQRQGWLGWLGWWRTVRNGEKLWRELGLEVSLILFNSQ